MDKVYASLIRKGLKTLDDVPAHLRQAVEMLLGAPDTGEGEEVE